MDLNTLTTYLSACFSMKDLFSLFFLIQLLDQDKLSEPSGMKSIPCASFFSVTGKSILSEQFSQGILAHQWSLLQNALDLKALT